MEATEMAVGQVQLFVWFEALSADSGSRLLTWNPGKAVTGWFLVIYAATLSQTCFKRGYAVIRHFRKG